MGEVPAAEHDCEWKERAEKLESELADVRHSLAALQKAVFGKKSEKLPPVDRELRKGTKSDPKVTADKRRAARDAKAELPGRTIHHSVRPEDRHCPKCGSLDLRALGAGLETVVF